MSTSIMLYVIAGTEIVGCMLLFLAATDLHALSSSQLQGALSLYEKIVAEIAAEIDALATDGQLTDSLYAALVQTVATITEPANASVVRETLYENGLLVEAGSSESAALFQSSMDALTERPALRERYAGVVMKSVRAASLWDLAFQASNRPFLEVPAWVTNPWRERYLIDRSRYDESLVRTVLNRLGVVDQANNPLSPAY